MKTLTASALYSDSLVEITEQDILFRLYYFPIGLKRIVFADIESIAVEASQPSPTPRYRLWGTDDLRTWFACDWYRPNRNMVFKMKLKTQSMQVGFTVENPSAVLGIFRQKQLHLEA